MANQLEVYEQMAVLSSRMVTAARAGDWGGLIDLERQVALLGNAIADDPDANSAANTPRKAALIQRILSDDAEIRRHTEPWMERLRSYLGEPAPQAGSLLASRLATP